MSRNVRIAIAIVQFFAFPVLARQSADEQGLRAQVGKYFDAHVRKDLDAFAALWSERSPTAPEQIKLLQRMFATYTYEFTEAAISRVKIDGANASLRVSTKRTTQDAIKNRTAISQVLLDLSFVKEEKDWKLWGERSAVSSLFDLLAAAKDDAEREKSISEDPESVTLDLLMMLNSSSDYAYSKGNYDRALSLLSSARIVAEKLPDRAKAQAEAANAWHNIGIIHFLKLRYREAQEAYQNGLAIYQQLGRKQETARALMNIGLIYNAWKQYKEAIDYFQRSGAIYEELNARGDLAQTLENIGNARYEQGDYALASEAYQKSVRVYEAAGAKASVVNRLLQIAQLEYERGNDASAIDFYQQALARMDERAGKGNRGYALHNIANIYYTQGDYRRALDYYQRSCKTEEESGNQHGAASALLGVGLVHALEANYQLSLEAYEKYLSLAESVASKGMIAQGLQKVGGAHFNLKVYQKALDAFQKALLLRLKLGDQQETAGALLDVGIGYGSLGDYPKALENYQKSRDLYQSAGNFSGVAGALLNTSVVYFAQGDYATSLEIAGEAGSAAKKADDLDLYWQARHRAGRAQYRLGQLEAARQALTEAIAIIETKLSPGNRNREPRFYESKLSPYLAMVDVMIAWEQGSEAFNFAERANVRVLLGVLQSARVWIRKSMTPEEAERERHFLTEQATLSAQIYRENEREKPNQDRIVNLNARLKKTRLDFDQFKNGLYLRRPFLKVMRGEGKPLTSEQAAALATDTRTALLNFIETDERVYLFAFTRARARAIPALKIYPLATTRADLEARIDGLNQKIASRDPEYQAPARELFDLLFIGAQGQLAGKTRLIIAPDGALWRLPFQVLQPRENVFLIEDHSISYAPTLTAHDSIRKQGLRRRSRSPGPTNALLVGDQLINQQTADAQVWTGADANEFKFKSESGKYGLIQLALPGSLNDAGPLFSSLTFAKPGGDQEDGLFEVRELLELDLKAALLILSRTEAINPQTSVGRALAGLSWASFIAGSPAVLVSQRRAEPESTTQLMREFHRELLTVQPKSVAWQNAVKHLLARDDYRHPYFWAGFTLFGN